jgi:hypothetical protein
MTTKQYAYLANKHPRAGHDWSPVEDELMLVHMQSRWPLHKVVLSHGRTEGAIMARVHRLLGLHGYYYTWEELCERVRGLKWEKLPVENLRNLCYFWMVAGDGPTNFRHMSEQAAIDEAKRLAALQPGQEFFVMKATHRVSTNTVTVTKLEP